MARMLAAANVAYRAFLFRNPEIQDCSTTYLTFLEGFKACMEVDTEPGPGHIYAETADCGEPCPVAGVDS